MSNGDVITLSSDEEDAIAAPKKRIKLTSILKTVSTLKPSIVASVGIVKTVSTPAHAGCIILSDEEDENKTSKSPVSVSVVDLVEQFEECTREESPVHDPVELIEEPADEKSFPVIDSINVDISEFEECTNEEISGCVTVSNELNSARAIVSPTVVSKNGSLIEIDTYSLSSSEDEAHPTAIVENGRTEEFVDHSNITKLYKNFLDVCVKNIKVPEQKVLVNNKLKFMQDAFDKYQQLSNDLTSFEEYLEDNLRNIDDNPKKTLIYFSDVYQRLKLNLRELSQQASAPTGKEKIIKKLERLLAKLKKRIDKLDEAECNWENDENSSYMQSCRYKQRAAQVYQRLCKIRKLNPYSGRVLHQRLKFQQSKHSDINSAINQKYKNNTGFPTYQEIEEIVRKCNNDSNSMNLNELEMKIEAKKCFEKLGNYIQGQRRLELYSLHSDFLIDAEDDPAKDNPSLQGKLLESYQIKVEQETEIFAKYSAMQENKGQGSDNCSETNSDNDDENDSN